MAYCEKEFGPCSWFVLLCKTSRPQAFHQVLSAQSRDDVQARRPGILEGEAAGPSYSTTSGDKGDPRPLLNGTGGDRPTVSTGVSTSVSAPASGTRTSGEHVSETGLGAPTRVNLGVGVTVDGQAQPPPPPQPPQLPTSQQGRQLEAETGTPPLEAAREGSEIQRPQHQQQQRLVSPSVSSMVHHGTAEGEGKPSSAWSSGAGRTTSRSTCSTSRSI